VELTMPTPETVRVTLSRPTIDAALIGELHEALDRAERTPDCRMVVLQGGDGTFCTGMDFTEALGDGDPDGTEFFGLLRRFTMVPRVVVSIVDGQVAAGGVGLVAASDLVYASGRSTFALPEALWGLLPCAVLPFLIRRVGFQKAYAMTLSTLPVSAADATGCHLVDAVADEPSVPLRRLAYRLAKLDGSTVGDVKRYAGRLWPVPDEVGRLAVEEFARLVGSPAVQRRMADFATHRRMPWER
jgi:3-carboxymethyl-3-hydroxy-acyl-[acp] dehydratase